MSVKRLTDILCQKNLEGLLKFIEQNENNLPQLNEWLEKSLEVIEYYDPEVLDWYYGEAYETVLTRIDKGVRLNYLQLLLANRPIEKGFNKMTDDGEILIDTEDYLLLQQLLPADMVADAYKPINNDEIQQVLIGEVERRLGLPFFKNLSVVVKTRLTTLAEECVGYYLEEILNGIHARTHVDVWKILEQEIPQDYKDYGAGNRLTGTYLLDILAAMGETASGYAFMVNGELMITDRGIETINRVYNPFWRGVIDAKGVYGVGE